MISLMDVPDIGTKGLLYTGREIELLVTGVEFWDLV